jgi:putative transposase
VAESGRYARRDRLPSARTVRHIWLTEVNIGIRTASCDTYGFRRVQGIHHLVRSQQQ